MRVDWRRLQRSSSINHRQPRATASSSVEAAPAVADVVKAVIPVAVQLLAAVAVAVPPGLLLSSMATTGPPTTTATTASRVCSPARPPRRGGLLPGH